MSDSEYRYFPMIMDHYTPGMYLEKGWWARSVAGTVMTILYGSLNVEETEKPLKEGESDIGIKGDLVLVKQVGSFANPGQHKLLMEALSNRDMKEVLDEEQTETYWFRCTKKSNDFIAWTIFRPQTKKEKQDACNGVLGDIQEQEICSGCAKRGKGFCDHGFGK